MRSTTSLVIFLLLAVTAFSSNVQICYLDFFEDNNNKDVYIHRETANIGDPTRWSSLDAPDIDDEQALSSVIALQDSPVCSEVCTVTIYSTPTFDGMSEVYVPYNDNSIVFAFPAKSFIMDCGPYIDDSVEEEEEEEEEEEMEEEVQEEGQQEE